MNFMLIIGADEENRDRFKSTMGKVKSSYHFVKIIKKLPLKKMAVQ